MDSTGIKIKSPAEIETEMRARHRELLERIKEHVDHDKISLFIEGQLFELTFTAVRMFGVTLNA